MIENVSVDKLVFAEFNPAGRITDSRLKNLKALIETEGKVVNPIHVIPLPNGKYFIVDGHCRSTISKSLGYNFIPAYVHSDWKVAEAPKWWATLNSGRPHTSQQWAEAYFRSSGKVKLKSAYKSNITKMIRVWGARKAKDLVLNHSVSPSVVHCLGQVMVRLKNAEGTIGEFEELQVGDWLIEHKMQNAVNALFRGTGSINVRIMRKLAKAIRANKPFDLLEAIS